MSLLYRLGKVVLLLVGIYFLLNFSSFLNGSFSVPHSQGPLSFALLFIAGTFTGFHCAGMCGPIVWIMPFQLFSGLKRVFAIALYHVGRISVYALLALVLHSFRNLFDPKIQQYISIVLGSILLVTGVLSFFSSGSFAIKLPWAEFVKKQLGKVIGQPRLGAITAAGILNGMLPCGLVYMALSASMTVGSSGQAAGLMYFFGIGTMPMLVSITLLKHKVQFLRLNQVKRLVPIVVFGFGCLFVLRGMNLGIPYLSPKVVVAQNGIHSCCHKK
jgi:sulfite exporter TauE/SafE